MVSAIVKQKMKFPLILASASPRRQELLTLAGIPFEMLPSQAEETFLPGESSEAHVLRLARAKALKVTERHSRHWVLAADTIVEIDGQILGKPKNRQDAEEMLRKLSDQEHRVVTGYCLVRSDFPERQEGVAVTRVRFKELSDEEIQWYISSGEPFDKAGGYAIQGRAAFMVKEIYGSYTNVVGLPLCEVVGALQKVGMMKRVRGF
jgi:septum formation protein